MDLNFGTPARLERQIAQHLMETQSDFDLSVPGGDTRDISASITRTPLAPSNRHNSSFSRPSDSSEASATSPAKHTHLAAPHATRQPVTLAAAVQNAHHPPNGDTHQPINALSTSSSTSSVSDSPHSAQFPDPYSHVRSTSPPLTSTPHRTVAAASTVGSRSRTIVAARPIHPSSAQNTDTHPCDDTAKSLASRATRSAHSAHSAHSARSASAVLDDLTESSIAPEEVSQHDQHTGEQHSNQAEPQQHQRDFVVYDAPSAPSTSQNASPAFSQVHNAAVGDRVDWRQRRAQRRQLVQVDESAIDDDESQPQPHPDSHTEDTATATATTTAYSSPAAARLARQSLATPKHTSASEERARMKQYLLNSVKATDRSRSRTARSSDVHLDAIERLKAQAQLPQSPASRSDDETTTSQHASPITATNPTPRRRMDRLGKANTIAAGRTPLPKGGVAQLLRQGTLFGVSDSSIASSAAAEPPLRTDTEPAQPNKDDDVASAVGSNTTYSEASSNDLALAPNNSKHGATGLRANTSFPGLGAANPGTQANSIARPRVDAAKLAVYQSKLNERLDAENEQLKRERDQLLQKITELESGSAVPSVQADVQSVNQQLQVERERADALDKEAQELADLLDEKERELKSLKTTPPSPRIDDEHDKQLQLQINHLQALLKERDEDVEELEARLERERTQMEEQVEQAKTFSLQTLDKIESERDHALERIRSLEDQLRDAQTHIAQLEAKAQQPNTSTSSPVQDERIRLLERHKSELEQRVQQYREMMISKGVGTNLANLSKNQDENDASSVPPVTPARTHIGSSPLPKSVVSLRNISAAKTPRSPGPLSDASWLYNESSLGAANVVDRIVYLEGALDEANASIDAKLHQLDQAGVAHLTLAERLQQAHKRIASLEAEIETLRLAGNHSIDSTNATTTTKNSTQRQKVFADVHAQLEALKTRWAADHDKLQQRERELERRERELHDRTTEKHQYDHVLAELQRFKLATESLQRDLQEERAKQKSMLEETRAVGQQKHSIQAGLSRTNVELEAVKRKLERKIDGLEHLGRECMDEAEHPQTPPSRRENTQRLTERFHAAQTEVELLKAERNDLLAQRADLHHKFATANENYEQVLSDLATSRTALAEHQKQLDDQIEQMEAAHTALRSKKSAYEKIVGDRDRLRAERDLIIHDVGMFEHELRRLRREADQQGADLASLLAERQTIHLHHQSTTQSHHRERTNLLVQVKTLVHQLESKSVQVDHIKSKLDALERSSSLHPPPYMDNLHSLKSASEIHDAECQGLLLHIKYLKFKLVRESNRCADLSHQKQYISLLLKGFLQTDLSLSKLILDLNLNHPPTHHKISHHHAKLRWRKPLNAVMAIARMKRLAHHKQSIDDIKHSLHKAHEEVRSRRNVLPIPSTQPTPQ